jgi:hypothetical protein
LLLALLLSSCTTLEFHRQKDVVICLIISPGSPDTYTYYSPSFSDVVPNKPLPADKIGLNTTTGEIDLTRLLITPGDASDPRRPVNITYSVDAPLCPGNAQYSFYFMHRNPPLVAKVGDPAEIADMDTVHDGDTHVTVRYKNDPKDTNFTYSINYTRKKIDGGKEEDRRTPDPNIKNTP